MQTYLVWMKPVALTWFMFKSVEEECFNKSGWYSRGFGGREDHDDLVQSGHNKESDD